MADITTEHLEPEAVYKRFILIEYTSFREGFIGFGPGTPSFDTLEEAATIGTKKVTGLGASDLVEVLDCDLRMIVWRGRAVPGEPTRYHRVGGITPKKKRG